MSSSKALIEKAHAKSRLRPVLFAFATLVFLLVQVITRPGFGDTPASHGWRLYAWMVNAVLLLMCFGSGGFLARAGKLRALLNDEVADLHYQRASKVGFWTAMLVALVTYTVPALRILTGQQVGYFVIVSGVSTAMLWFSWLEYQAHRDA